MSIGRQMTANELLAYIFDDPSQMLAAQFADWIAASIRFRAFATTYRDKIRKKIRGVRDAEGLKDLWFELETAYILLQERRFSVEYEKYGVGKSRGPDFCVTFKTSVAFNLEVTRMRSSDGASGHQGSDQRYEIGKLADTVCGKLGQMLPSMINVLIVVADNGIDNAAVTTAMLRLRELAARKEGDFLTRKGFNNQQDFLKHYHRLSGVLLRGPSDHQIGKPPILWVNTQAKHLLPADLRAILQK